jgi:hypothetical protein
MVAGSYISAYYGFYFGLTGGSVTPTTFGGNQIIGIFVYIGSGLPYSFEIILQGTSVIPPDSEFSTVQFTDRNGVVRTFYRSDALISTDGSHPTRKIWTWSSGITDQYFNSGTSYGVYIQ